MKLVYRDIDTLAEAAAARLILALSDAQQQHGRACVALTGGGVGTKILEFVRQAPLRCLVDWSAVEVWWGDDRFVEADNDDRNELGARRALLDHVPVAAANVHAMPPRSADRPDLAAAAEAFGQEYRDAGPQFDVVLLGMGPDGHVASIFPDRPDLMDAVGPVVTVIASPKPPPERISLSLQALNTANEVWVVAAGAEKAGALEQATHLGSELPVAKVAGRNRTLWLLDAQAAGARPSNLEWA